MPPLTRTVALLGVACTLVAAGCTAEVAESSDRAGRDRAARSAATTPTPPPRQTRVSLPAQRTTVLTGEDAGTLAVQVSRTLYDEAPAVVLAPAADPVAQGEAATTATRLGLPLLVVPDPAVPAELDRLGTTTVLTFGGATGWARGESGAADVVPAPRDPRLLAAFTGEDLGRQPVEGADPLDGLVLLVEPGLADSPAAATARATGARLVGLRGDDPRADRRAIAGLSERPVSHVVALGDAFGDPDLLGHRVDVAATGVELPGGGQVVFPGRRLVALYGHPGTASLGVLGEQPLSAAIRRAKRVAAAYDRPGGRPVVPAFEIIAAVASGGAGRDGNYANEVPAAKLRPWVEAAGRAGVYVVLDIQPGRTPFLPQAKRYASLLRLPHVGLALDPEWRLAPGQRHLRQVGSVRAQEVNQVVDWLADLTARNRLPQKLLVLHQFRMSMIRDRQRLDAGRDELAVLIQMDGNGPPGTKLASWRAVTRGAPDHVRFGWKTFYDEDRPTFSPARTMRIKPSPLFVSYQ